MDESGRRPAEGFPPGTPPAASPVYVEITGSELERRAVQLGTVAGKAVAVFRRARREWQELDEGGEHDAAQKARKVADLLRREAAARTDEWGRAAIKRRDELRRQAKDGYERSRARARQGSRDYPLQVVVVAGVAGFVLGTGLRIWRSKRGI